MKHTCLGGLALALLGAWLIRGPLLRAQAPVAVPQRPTFSATVEYVEVDARVVDGKGNPVRNLPRTDFHLFEDGKEQTIESFSAIDLPVELTSSSSTTSTTTRAAAAIEPDVAINRYGAEATRVYVIVLDDRQIDAQRTFNTIKIVRSFIERDLGPRDLAAIITTSGRTDISQTLTGNKTLLLKAVDGFVGRKLESEAILTFNGMHPQTSAEWLFEATTAMRAVRDVVTWMAGMRGRSKVLLLVSEGLSANYEGIGAGAESILDEERQVIDAATRGNVTINAVDPRGLYAYDELTGLGSSTAAGVAAAVAGASARERGVSTAPTEARGGDTFVGGAEQTALNRAFRAEVDRAQMSLRLIADETGGLTAVNTNNIQVVLDRIVGQQSTYYLLGYYPKNNRRDGKNRSIEVKVNGRGLKVIARRGYREAKGNAAISAPTAPGPADASPELRAALNSPVPIDTVPLAATAAAFRGENGKASIAVIVEMSPGAVDLVEKDGRFAGTVEMATVAIDRRNVVAAGEGGTINLQFTREGSERLKEQGFRALTKLDEVSPGRYQIRAAMAGSGSAQPASVWYDIEVPDFAKGDLSMSGVVIASARQDRMPTGNAGKLFDDVLAMPPTARRQFTATDELIAFAEVYANGAPAAANVDITVTNDAGEVVVRRGNPIAADAFTANGVYRSVAHIPLANLSPGFYVLRVQAARRDGGNQAAARTVPFRIVP